MARPYRETFEKDAQSPMTPMSSGVPNTPISYKTNVNRQKTTKWANAKPASYDDWDDDDDYGDEQPPPPPAASKPTGLRQQGQAAHLDPNNEAPAVVNKRNYGDLPGVPGRSGSSHVRTNSFDADDEKRNFSSGTVRQQSPPPAASPGPATRFSQITGVPSSRGASGPPALSVSTQVTSSAGATGLRKPSVPAAPVSVSSHPDPAQPRRLDNSSEASSVVSPVSLSDARTPSIDYQTRRDYSPTALPQPLRAGSAGPQSAIEPQASKFPARKSSLSQSVGPNVEDFSRPSQEVAQPTKPWVGARTGSPGVAPPSPASQAKALPFIRPADIYKRRMEEEKERQSMESSRPSMDSIEGTNQSERSETISNKPFSQERPGSDGGGAGPRQRTSIDTDDSSEGSRLRPVLEPVKERKSEYGFEGFNVDDPSILETEKNTFDQSVLAQNRQEAEEVRSQSTSPKLPDLNRISGFGMDIFTKPKTEPPVSPIPEGTKRELKPTQDRVSMPEAAQKSKDSTNSSNDVETQDSSATLPLSKPLSQSGVSISGLGGNPTRTTQVTEPTALPEQGGSNLEPTPSTDINDLEELKPPRPIAEREQSFRPELPGGWTSYATTARSETPQEDPSDISHVSGGQIPTRDISPSRRNVGKEDTESAPFAKTNQASERGLGAEINDNASIHSKSVESFEGRHIPSTVRAASPGHEDLKPTPALPTPDPAMAPGGSLYSTTALDPRLSSKLERVSPETQLRPDIVERTTSSSSKEAPTPLPKDTPVIADKGSGYFTQPSVPLKPASPNQHEPGRGLKSTTSRGLPTLSTNNGQQDEESDRLHKEIVKSLSPKPSETVQHANSTSTISSDEKSSSNPARISSYLPSEYDHYWESTAEDDSPLPPVTAPTKVPESQSASLPTNESVIGHDPDYIDPTLSPQPLSPRKSDQTISASRPSGGPHRFSWEASLEDVSNLSKQNTPSINNLAQPKSSLGPDLVHPSSLTDSGEVAPQSYQLPDNQQFSSETASSHIPGAVETISGAALGGVGAATVVHSKRRLSLAEEKDPQVSTYAIPPTPPEDEHPSRSPHLHFPVTSTDVHDPSIPPFDSNVSAPPSSISPVTSSTQAQIPSSGPILPFKEIAAMHSPQQRVQKYDETRQQFASMESGLTNWILNLQSQHPEYSNLNVIAPAISKFAKPSSSGQAPPLQQPYYQQYLNASSPSLPGTAASRPGPSTPVGPQQGFSSGGTTSQQVQAKGKELLHTAGVFGGKAGKVGKGLLAKGKNKLRGAGGGDKDPSSPPTKTKPDRRTSWGLPLTLSRSTGKQDGSSRTSMESTPVPLHSRQRAATLTLDTSRGAGKSPMTGATDNDDYDIMSAPGILDNLSNMSGALPAVVSPVSEETAQNSSQDQSNAPQNMIKSHSSKVSSSGEPKVEAKLGVPAPIGKSQPSWDPINATPIAEEEGFHFEQRTHDSELPNGPQQITQPQSKALHVPKETSLSKGPTSRGSNFYDASEEPSDLNEWVVVPKQVDSKQDRSSSPPRIPEIAVMQTYFGMEGSHNSDQAPSKVADEAQPALSHRTSGNLDVSHDKIPEDNNLDVASRPRAGSILDRPRYSYDVPRVDPASSWNQNMQTEKHAPFVSAVPAIPSQQSFISTPEDTSKPSAIYSTRPPSQQEPLVQPRYSYDVPRASQASALPKARTVQPEYRPFPVNTSVQSMQPPRTDEEPQSTTSFKGLPPIRRTSTFGKGFGSRQAKSRFTIDDADPVPNLPSQLADSGRRSAEIAIAAGVATLEGIAHREAHRQSRSGSLAQEDPSNPSIAHAGSSDRSQHTMTRPTQSQQLYNAPRAADFPPENEEYRSSQDSWRPNIATPTRTSFEQQQNRQSFGQRAPSHQQSRSFDQPPSSAQRYPSLFPPEQPAFEGPKDGDLPAHYYQAPLAREQVFLPRHQTNEYQLPGVGPPADEPRPASRRNSGIFKDISNKIRSVSRERGNSLTQDGDQQYYNRYNAEANEYAESSVASEDGQERNKRRNSLFGKLTRASTGLDTPQSRESMVAHTAGSRTGLALTPGQTPVQSPVLGNESKRSFFGDKFGDSKGKSSKPLRASVDGKADDSEKKKSGKRFSNLSNMFGRSKDSPRASVSSPHPEAMRELSYQERQPLESPAPTQGLFAKPQSSPQQKQNNNSSPKQSSQQRGLLAKLSGAGEPTKDRQESKTRKLSATPGLLSGIMGRRSQQSDKRDDSSSQGTRSQGSQPKEYRPNQVPPARTYTDIAENATPIAKQAPNAPWHEENRDMLSGQGRDRNRERGRQTSREPHVVPEPRYDTVPIPGGYNLVRGDGAAAVPTAYDPKGYNQVQTTNVPYTQHGAPVHQNTSRVPGRAHVEQQLPPVQTSASYVPAQSRPLQSDVPSSASNNHSSRRLSREDMLARSPAREPNGQQRPYQLSLPEDEEDRQPLSLSMNIPIISPPRSSRSPSYIQVTPDKTPEHNSIQRLAQPILRHPESPAGYPLPDDTVFSPINPSASHLPPPPPPKWPEHLDNQDHHHLHLSIDRSDTRRTAVSGISQVSGISGQPSMLVPQASGNKSHDRSGISPSPTPPSPGITPPPQQRSGSPQRDVRRQSSIQTTTLIRNHSPDLYNASPRLPKVHGNSASGPHGSKENQRAAAISSAQEEKIVADDGHLGLDDNDNEPATMSATSYPGQEWNPYAGVYMEEYD